MEKVEIAFKLIHSLDYYDKILISNGLKNVFNVKTHDIYYTNKNLDNLSEEEMKNSCIRLRSCSDNDFEIQNNLIKEVNITKVKVNKLKKFEEKLIKLGYKKVFDTLKYDHHYYKEGMESRVQLQEIDNIGLIVYYDNPKYYNLSSSEQRIRLIDELNSYGLNEINYEDRNFNKLRTLYYHEEYYS